MPWSVPPLRLGRSWARAPDPAWLKARWKTLTRTEDEGERAALFEPSRSRTLRSAVAPLPGRAAPDCLLAHEQGSCPEPVRLLHGPYDQQWLIPDHRLIDSARAQLWRVSDAHQTHLVETAHDPGRSGPLLTFTTLLPDGHSPAGRPGRIRPLHRRPGGCEPNVLPGLLEHLSGRLGVTVEAEDVLAWTAAAVRGGPNGRVVPLTSDAALWTRGVSLGRRTVWIHTRGARCGPGPDGTDRPRLPGGHRPYVRAPLPAACGPGEVSYDAGERALHVAGGRVAPVDSSAWEFEVGGVQVLEEWFARRAEPAAPGTLAAVRPRGRPQEGASELLELITVLTMLAELRTEQRDLAMKLEEERTQGAAGRGTATGPGAGAGIGRSELESVGLLPPPAVARRPASVLDLAEEGPGGQLALL
ncbi:type ISP restriction/modification enzyme [Streptomyces ovatisporus]|uniref:Type ISP restriction/modification enzyme n=1 Tax=Streptomyces ovatisporus TaxID=1128682 RepID=A0ABV9ACJ3_9ACTN